MKKIAVVIPVFNVEKYIGKCLDSVINQTIGITNLQVIVINDGSSDESLKIVENYQQIYPDCFIVKTQINQGLSAARNSGMEYINAEYTLFLDSDDLLEEVACENLYKYAHQKKADLVIARMKSFPEGVDSTVFGFMLDRTQKIDFNDKTILLPLSAGGKLYYSNSLRDIRFNSQLKIKEDVEFNIRYLLKNHEIYFLNESLYLYRQRTEQNSIMDLAFRKSENYFNY